MNPPGIKLRLDDIASSLSGRWIPGSLGFWFEVMAMDIKSLVIGL